MGERRNDADRRERGAERTGGAAEGYARVGAPTDRATQDETAETAALTGDFERDVAEIDRRLRVGESFDLLRREVRTGEDRLVVYGVDGLIKDAELQKTLQTLQARRTLGDAQTFALSVLPAVEITHTGEIGALITAVLSGEVAFVASSFGAAALTADLRTYPTRDVAEPETDKVMQGAKDGFVETLITNTALIRRRIRDPRLTMRYRNLGGASRTDVVLCYMDGIADDGYVAMLSDKLARLRPASLTMGYQTLAEMLAPRRWYNPFPKIRTVERPDSAAAQLMEGRVLILCDTSPRVMVLPTSLLDYLQETDDYYFPPLTGSYQRIIRLGMSLLALLLTPLWYLALEYADALPERLAFLVPTVTGALPMIWQLVLAEFAVDALKLASMNTPNMLSNSLSIIGGLILGDFAVTVGWLSPDVILYMSLVAISGFTQKSQEMIYAMKMLRLALLALTALFRLPGFLVGLALIPLLLFSNRTLNGRHSYLWPLVPFDGRALGRLFFRRRKKDFRVLPPDAPRG
ncbi:MAG: spore germination protein, partial [Clostridia bacterium]|nr:spore germination protein [Clostridia bacterium]